MVEALHLGTVGLAAVGACCTAAAKSRGKTLNMITALIMFLAMADTALHLSPIPGAGWAAIMLVAALGSAFASRRGQGGSDARAGSRFAEDAVSRNRMSMHRNIGLILTGAFLIVMDTHPMASGHMLDSSHFAHDGHAADALVLVLSAGAALFAAASGWMALRRHGSPRSNRIEAAAMGLSMVIMSLTGIG